MAYVITAVGAGGKTTYLKKRALEYLRQGKRCALTTTTHIWPPDPMPERCGPEYVPAMPRYGRLYDSFGFMRSILPVCAMLAAGYALLYFTVTTVPVFIGSLLMMAGYLTGMSIFGAVIRDNIPEG